MSVWKAPKFEDEKWGPMSQRALIKGIIVARIVRMNTEMRKSWRLLRQIWLCFRESPLESQPSVRSVSFRFENLEELMLHFCNKRSTFGKGLGRFSEFTAIRRFSCWISSVEIWTYYWFLFSKLRTSLYLGQLLRNRSSNSISADSCSIREFYRCSRVRDTPESA